MLKKIAYAGSQSASFVQGAKDLEALADVKVTAKRVERWTKRVGDQRVAEVESASNAYQALSFPARRQSPRDQVPKIACVQMDGGRIQIRDRNGSSSGNDAKGHWRETLVGCLLSMTGDPHSEDPCPTIPQTFVDPARIGDLSRDIKGFSSEVEEVPERSDPSPGERPGRPKPLVRSIVATRQGIGPFGKRLIAAAHARGFNASGRKAFVADGAASNWSIHRKHFSHYTPILDFTHAVCYVYAAAMAGRTAASGWSEYCQWAQWLWEGNTCELIGAVTTRAEELGPPSENESETSPKKIVANTLRYLKNQRLRMGYSEYRRLGLPITSSHIESTIKQINRRVKGTEKFWHQGAEPILQLAADHISETDALDRFWKNRPKCLQLTRCYQTAV